MTGGVKIEGCRHVKVKHSSLFSYFCLTKYFIKQWNKNCEECFLCKLYLIIYICNSVFLAGFNVCKIGRSDPKWNTHFFGLSYERPYLVLDLNLIWKVACKLADYTCKPVDYTCKLAVDTCKPAVYTCKVLNFRFTSVTLITLLDTVEVTPFFSQFSGKLHVIHCKLLVYTCKLPVYTCKPPVYSKGAVYNL